VVERLAGMIQAQPLGEIKMRGRKKPAFAYDLIGLNSSGQ